ncbi:L,D-transpeptidase family protein [Chondrinema litorale]|uniref:L,D-transpeptidase family protein n=1 Tax=Chondrinema litorale TaxID=2994555 RepID=UPI002543AFA2|nr:hypothetical protein [Chondrinema litorale]UZR95201.1 hypothetical protein OQ292_05135 [Chondrinema litorale]
MLTSLVFAFPWLIWFSMFGTLVNDSFKKEQKRYPRVRTAYAEQEQRMLEVLATKSVRAEELEIYIRAFKADKKLELWGKNRTDTSFKLLKVFEVCQTSGKLGPKRMQGDLQIPEGFYHIDRFNPYSTFYLSLGINYPNQSDRILGRQGNLGGDIFIHGSCVTIGCLPIQDDPIKALYLYCIEAKNNGQQNIPVTIFPTELTTENYNALKEQFASETANLALWEALKKDYDLFNQSQQLSNITFLSDGKHRVCTDN